MVLILLTDDFWKSDLHSTDHLLGTNTMKKIVIIMSEQSLIFSKLNSLVIDSLCQNSLLNDNTYPQRVFSVPTSTFKNNIVIKDRLLQKILKSYRDIILKTSEIYHIRSRQV